MLVHVQCTFVQNLLNIFAKNYSETDNQPFCYLQQTSPTSVFSSVQFLLLIVLYQSYSVQISQICFSIKFSFIPYTESFQNLLNLRRYASNFGSSLPNTLAIILFSDIQPTFAICKQIHLLQSSAQYSSFSLLFLTYYLYIVQLNQVCFFFQILGFSCN